MPELPEVETIKIDLQKTLVGKKILGVETDSKNRLTPKISDALLYLAEFFNNPHPS